MSDRINTFSESAMKQIAREVFRGERQSIVSLIGDHIGKHGSSRRTGPMNQTPVQIKNSTAEEIPPHGVCRVIGTDIRGGWEWVEVAKPDGSSGLHVINGQVKIAANGTGFGTWLGEGGRVAYDSGLDTPAANDELGPVADSWLAGSGKGIKVVGPVRDGVVNARFGIPSTAVRFRLKTGQTLTPLGSALARILTWDADESEWVEGDSDITVAEPYTATTGQFRGFEGYEGWCVHRHGTTYDIVWMEHPAEWIKFELQHKFGYATAGQALATVLEYTNGRAPLAEVIVYENGLNTFGQSMEGSQGIAFYDYVTDRYVAVRCQQHCIFATATAVQMCPDSSEPLQVSNIRYLPHGEHVLTPDPEPLTYAAGLRNPFLHAVAAGGGVLLEWDDGLEEGGAWRVYDVSRVAQWLTTKVEIITDSYGVKKLRGQKIKAYIETCGTETPYSIIDMAACPTE